jgi:hypothetical protein
MSRWVWGYAHLLLVSITVAPVIGFAEWMLLHALGLSDGWLNAVELLTGAAFGVALGRWAAMDSPGHLGRNG